MNYDEEILQRVRRIETRLHKLCEHEGVAPPPGRPLAVKDCGFAAGIHVDVQGLDTTLSAILTSLQNARLSAEGREVVVSTPAGVVARIHFGL